MKSKEFVRPMPPTWFLKNTYLKLFMLREATAIFVAIYAVYLLLLLSKANVGLEAFKETLTCTTGIIIQILCLPFVIFHSVTWFNLTPKAIVLFQGEERVSPLLIAGGHYLLWIVVSVGILLVVD